MSQPVISGVNVHQRKLIQGQSGVVMVHSNIGQLARSEFLKTWPFMVGKTLDEIYVFGRKGAGEASGRPAPAADCAQVSSLPVGNHGDNNL